MVRPTLSRFNYNFVSLCITYIYYNPIFLLCNNNAFFYLYLLAWYNQWRHSLAICCNSNDSLKNSKRVNEFLYHGFCVKEKYIFSLYPAPFFLLLVYTAHTLYWVIYKVQIYKLCVCIPTWPSHGICSLIFRESLKKRSDNLAKSVLQLKLYCSLTNILESLYPKEAQYY